MISLEVFLVGLGSIMLVLGYLTAKIRNIEKFNLILIEKLNPPKFKALDVVRIPNRNINTKYIIKYVSFDKEEMTYRYKVINTNTYHSIDCIYEYEMESFSTKNNQETTNEDKEESE